MRRFLAFAAVSLLLASCSATSPVACEADAACDGGKCLGGACFSRACGNVTCGADKVCSEGACVDELCANKTCEAGSTCLRGDCAPTACSGTPCPAGFVCDAANQCVDASCFGVICPAGQACVSGLCLGGSSCGGSTCGAGQVCVANACFTACGSALCAAGQVCDVGQCTAPDCVGVRCDGGTCSGGQCYSGTVCGSTVCPMGQACDVDTCVEPACVGVRCDGGVCQAGTCKGLCEVSCTTPCPACTNGRACTARLDCESRNCAGNVCTACTQLSDCPNGGLCQAGICRSGLLGPCASVLDCKPNTPALVCDQGLCRLPAGASCASDAECIQSLKCENLVCQRPRCLLTLLETQVLPQLSSYADNEAFGLSPAGELYVTAGQWTAGAGFDVRRYRVSPGGDAGIVEQAPTTAPLLTVPQRYMLQGHSDVPGSITGGSFGSPSPRSVHWLPAGGAFDGRVAVEIQFNGFNQDFSMNFTNIGRFAKCGNHFYFAGQTTTGRALVRFTTPNPVGSGTVAQVLTASAARRDNNVFQFFNDVACTPSTLYVLGTENAVVRLARLDPLTLSEKAPTLAFPGFPANGGAGELNLAVVSDDFIYLAGVRGEVAQVWDGGATNLNNVDYGAIIGNGQAYNANDGGLVIYYPFEWTVRRYARRMMDGTEPAPWIDCNWQ